MTEAQKEQFWELVLAWEETGKGVGPEEIEAHVSQLIAEAYQAGREDERKAVRLWGAK